MKRHAVYIKKEQLTNSMYIFYRCAFVLQVQYWNVKTKQTMG